MAVFFLFFSLFIVLFSFVVWFVDMKEIGEAVFPKVGKNLASSVLLFFQFLKILLSRTIVKYWLAFVFQLCGLKFV